MSTEIKTRKNRRDLQKSQDFIQPLINKFYNNYFKYRIIKDGVLTIPENLESIILKLDDKYRSFVLNFNNNRKNTIKLKIDWFINVTVNKINEDKKAYWMREVRYLLNYEYHCDNFTEVELSEQYDIGKNCINAAYEIFFNQK